MAARRKFQDVLLMVLTRRSTRPGRRRLRFEKTSFSDFGEDIVNADAGIAATVLLIT